MVRSFAAVVLLAGSLVACGGRSAAAPTATLPPPVAGATPETRTAPPTGTTSAIPTPVLSPTMVVPRANPSVTPGLEVAERKVTLDDNGKTIDLRVGDRFLLALEGNYDWSVAVDDPSIVGRVAGITTIRGAQGVYEARKPGQTTLAATGDPPCRKAQPPCLAPSRSFQVRLVVR